jgi:phage terminase large subunit-like protein
MLWASLIFLRAAAASWMMRELVRASEHDRDISLGHFICAWVEQHCVHGPGDVAGLPVDLDSEFAGFIVDCYSIGDVGRRLYDSVFMSRPKGRAKSELAGFIVLAEALAPARFDHWALSGEIFSCAESGCLVADCSWRYAFDEGEPVGHLVTVPVIRCLATEEGQAGNTYDNVHFNLTMGPLAAGMPRDGAGLTRTFLPNGGEIVPSTASNSSKDGGKETFVVFDETHLYIRPELHRMYATVRRNLAKRKQSEPWSLETSTMYMPGENSVAEETHNLAKAIAEGKTKRQRLLFDHREADADIDMTDEDQVRAGLKDVYGPFAEVMDIDRIVSEIYDPRNDPQDSRRYYFNQPTSSRDAWLSAPEWNACFEAREVLKTDEITLGFDGSRKRSRGVADATALVGCRVSDGYLFEIRVWEQPDGPSGDDWEVPTSEVDFEVRRAFEDYKVVGMFADPAKWESYIAQWESDFGKKLKVKSSLNHPIEWWMSGSRSFLVVRALEQFQNAVVDRELAHSGERTLTRHILNARRRVGRSGMSIAKEHPDSRNKIDAAVAAVLAYQARLQALSKGEATRSTFVPRRIR